MQIVRTAVSGLATAGAIAVFAIAMPVVASAHGHHHHHHHHAAAPAMCDQMQAPVCGMRGAVKQTFSNACWAMKDGATHIKKGACKW